MAVDNERSFKSSNTSWIWVRLFPEGDNKVGNHDHVTVKYRRFAHKDCSINLRLTKKFLFMFYNLRAYGSRLIFKKLVSLM